MSTLESVLELMRHNTAEVSHRFLMEEYVLGRQEHHELHLLREKLRSLELSEHDLQEKFAALGIPEEHALFKEKMDALHAASTSLDGDLRAQVEAANTAIAARIRKLEKDK